MTPTHLCANLAQCGKGRTAGGAKPTERLLDWAADAIGGNATIVSVRALHDDQGPWRLTVARRNHTHHLVLRSLTPRIDADMIATNAAALEVAERNHLRAPRLLAKNHTATLETLVAGSSKWPRTLPHKRLHAAGEALAQLHAIPLKPQPDLPLRPRPIAVDDFAGDRRRRDLPTTPLLQSADEQIQNLPRPTTSTVFLHGDVWPGNTAWTDDTHCTLIDWKSAGVGDPGIDLGELRKQIAITYDLTEIDNVIIGWEQATGTKATNLAYWDAVAALNTRTDLGPGITEKRDKFLRDTLRRLNC